MTISYIKTAVETLRNGGVIAYPSEGVWGLGCDPFNKEAVARVLKFKGRAQDKGLILVASKLQQILPLFQKLEFGPQRTLKESCPGPDTWLVPDPDQLVPTWIKGQFDSVAIRVSEHETVKALCDEFSGLIVSTSANPEGLPPAKSAEEVQAYFLEQEGGLDYIVPGELGSSNGPSTIRDLVSSQILRE